MPRTGAGGRGGGIFGWDGSDWQRIQLDASKFLKVILQTGASAIGKLAANDGVDIGDVGIKDIVGVAPQMDDTDKLAVSLYGKTTTAGDTNLQVAPTTFALFTAPGTVHTPVDGKTNLAVQHNDRLGSFYPLLTFTQSFNGTTWDRVRTNLEATLLAAAARTATTNSPDQTNYNHRGLILFVDVTARAAATTLTPNLQVKEPVGGNYITIWTAAAAINSADTTVAYLFYPSALADAAELYTEAVDLTLGRTWRLAMTHSDGNSVTYSVSCSMIL